MEDKKLLVEADVYLKAGTHIGTKFKSGEMAKYIYKVRKDGLKIFDVEMVDQRIKTAGKFLAQFPPERILVVARKIYGHTPVKEFAETMGCRAILGRFVPGTMTNPTSKKFIEPAVIIATEPEPDYQAISEATKMGVPVVAFCSTNNSTRNVDLVVPANNKGRKSLALIYWLLAKEIMKSNGTISKDEEFSKTLEDFEHQVTEQEKAPEPEKDNKFYMEKIKKIMAK